ncbi:MAG: 3-isopropylmalate/(R)-2-methylmalate dehydratase large subunit [Actinomycetota bacterium]|nr:3-isopropylmalate/(R)-2-methylmalate dehydratase large subunit [Actinomycetota bacterium]
MSDDQYGSTITEKILARASGRERVRPGDLIMAKVSLAMANDITAPMAIDAFRKIGVPKVWDRDRIALVPSHFVPAKDIASASLGMRMRTFAREQEITHFYEVGRAGIEHILLPEDGLVAPGDVIIGADSHSCTYGALGCFSTGVGSTDLAGVLATGEIWLRVPETLRIVYSGEPGKWVVGKDMILKVISEIGDDGALYMAMEHSGDTIAHLSMESRLTLTNMAIEGGAKSGIVPPDDLTVAYVKHRQEIHGRERPFDTLVSDPDARFARTLEIDVAALEPMVAQPSLPSRAVPVSEVEGQEVDQVFIGSCTNARMEDLRTAAALLEGRKAHPSIRLIVIPATQDLYQQALHEGLIQIFADAGASVAAGVCGPCLGGYMGVLGPGERCLSTSNRNYRGRMGHRDADVWLANPAVAAATAITGRITHPENIGALV